MKVKIKPEEIADLSKYVASKGDELDEVYKDIESIVNSVSDIWFGNDCKEFIDNSISSIKEEKDKNKLIRNFGKNLETVSKDLQEQEINWTEQIKRENLDNE